MARVAEELGRPRPLRREVRRNCRASASERGGEAGSRSAAVRAETWGNRPEGPYRAKGGVGQWNREKEAMTGTQTPMNISTKLERIATLARQKPGVPLEDAGASHRRGMAA